MREKTATIKAFATMNIKKLTESPMREKTATIKAFATPEGRRLTQKTKGKTISPPPNIRNLPLLG